MKKIISDYWPLIVIFFISLLGLREIFKSGYFPMHDDTQEVRVQQMAQSLSEGQFPVRWVADLGYGYGYPIFNFYNPLPYYFGAGIYLLGFNLLFAVKMMFIVGFLLSGLGMYLLANSLFGKIPAIMAALFFVFAPYHAVQLYVRGSIAEMWAYGLLPFIFYGLIKNNYLIAGISLGLLILSHNLTVLMVMPFLIVFFILKLLTSREKKKIFFVSLFSVLIGFGLSAFFWLPAVMENKYTKVNQMVLEKFNPLNHFVYPKQLINSFWGYAGSAPGLNDGMSFQAGKPQLFFAFLSFLLALYFFLKKKKTDKVYVAIFSFFIFSLFMLLPCSSFIWSSSSIFTYLQFPWRFLTFVSFFSALMSGWFFNKITTIRKLKKFFLPISCVFVVFFLLSFNLKYFTPQYLYAITDNFLTREKIIWEKSLISDEYLPLEFKIPKNYSELPTKKYFLSAGGQIKEVERKATYYNLVINSAEENFLTINNVFFPGWKAWLDKKPVEIINKNQLINLTIPAGEHQLLVKFTNTFSRWIGNLISLTTVLVLIFVYGKKIFYGRTFRY